MERRELKQQSMEVSTRLILTPFPAKDVAGRTEYARNFQDGRNRFSMTLKTKVSEESEHFAKRPNMDWIPTAELGRNLHALILGDVRRQMLASNGRDGRIVHYPSFAEVAKRIRCRYNTQNIEKIDGLMMRLGYLMVSYYQTGVKGTGLIGPGGQTRHEVVQFRQFADTFEREVTMAGKPVGFSFAVSEGYVATMGLNMTTVKEGVYMELGSSFAKDLYTWLVYGSRWAAAHGKATFDATTERLVKQLTEKNLDRTNRSYYEGEIRKWLKVISERDVTVNAVLHEGVVSVEARDRKALERDETAPDVTVIPTAGEEDSKMLEAWESTQEMIDDMKSGKWRTGELF